ncbi:MAG TPA: ABC transporter permease [Clostridiaceae bacterium]|nr:ABC transporter permease [Clostridiaceae bacterium]
MNIKHVWIVFKKEVKDIARDKKTLITSLLVPMIIIPLMNILVGGGVQKMQRDITENISIALSENSRTDEIKELIQNDILGNWPNIKLIDVDDPIEAIRQEVISAVLDFEKDYKEKMESGKPFTINIIYDRMKLKSEASLQMLSQAIGEFNARVVRERLTALNINPEILEPARIEHTDVADENKSSNPILIMTLPFMLGLLVVVGGIPAATDLVAGEKERNTFEPLLTTKPDRASILLGKYFTVTLFSFVSVVSIIIGFAIGYMINPNSLTMGTGTEITGFNIPTPALVLAILIAIALGMTFAGIQIALSTYARSFKEAQTYLSFLMIAAMIPGYATMFTQPADIQLVMYFIPVINTISAFKMVLSGTINYTNLLAALLSSVVYVALTLTLATSMFNKEKALFRS